MKFGYIDNNEKLEVMNLSLPKDNPLIGGLLVGEKSKNIKVYIGCPVWSQAGYVGKVYPKGTKAVNYLREYCKQFNTIEVNATRYGTPKLDTIEQWKSNSSKGFKFSLKIPQIISHRKDISDVESLQLMERFIKANYELGENMGCSFLQLPPYFSLKKRNQLEKFLDFLPDNFPISVELRHQDWFTQEGLQMAYDILSTRNVGFVITDSAGRRDVVHQMLTNKTVMIRFVGQMLHETDYKRIDDWVNKLGEWIEKGIENVYFFMHQPEPNKYLSANLVSYMIDEMNKRILKLNLKPPIDYSINEQKSLF